MAVVVRSRFYPHIALALALFVIIGFLRNYYFRFLTDLPPMVTVVHLHAIVFTGWLVLFVVQTRLIAAHRVAIHMRLGLAGLVLAACIVVLGVATAFHTAAVSRIRPSGLTPAQFAVVPLVSITLFAIFVGLGAALRRRAGAHKRFMVLAMIAVLGPPVGRLLLLFDITAAAPLVQPLVTATFVSWCLIHDWRHHRWVHPVFAIGGLVVVAAWPLRTLIARSEWWQPVGAWVAKVGAGI
ncbi:MAG TPA: hypothetical protein VJP84_17145 [Steroidobacteraceae bacterium]|jgi:hypothetical protein|nr:hypothetical protein [Steroidobacteraceae bacterium]